MRFTWLRAVLGVVVLSACGGGGSSTPIDAAAIDAVPIDAIPIDADQSVTGSSMITHYVRNGAGVTTMLAPEDLTEYAFAAYVPDTGAATGFRVIMGTGTANGTLRIPDMPMGVYYLKVTPSSGTPTFYYTDDRVLDLGYATAGRPGLADTTMASAVNPTITGLDRAWSTDVYSLSSLGAGTQQDNIDLGANKPIGAVPTLTASFDWMRGYGSEFPGFHPKLLANDDVEIRHQRETFTLSQQQSTVIGWLIEVARITGLTQTDGAALAVNGAFTDVAPNLFLDVDLALGALRTAYGNVSSVQELVVAGLGMAAGVSPHKRFGPDLTYVAVGNVKSSTARITLSLPYGNPYDATWPVVGYALYQRQRRVRVPGVAQNQPANLVLTDMVNAYPYTSGTITGAVQVAPPMGIEVGGTPATDGVRMFDGMAPVRVSWLAVTDATRYTVSVHRLTTQTSTTEPAAIVNAVTTETSVALPAELFTLGSRYVFVVSAVRDALPYATGTLKSSIVPSASAEAASGVIFLSNTCGNGTTDAGEECDTSGQSATCDVDCSLPVCLDGIVNSAAQEQCDAGVLTGGCDANCTLAMCGDGTVNQVAGEACDDNNAQMDDGCSPQCQFENRCGDGIRQSLFGEQCDDGDTDNTDACTNSCRTAACGDGFVYSGIEACDDGNLVSGDGCNATCMTEP